MYCKDYTPEELSTILDGGKTLGYYITEMEAYVERASIPHSKCGDLPPCPFAAAEMKKNRIKYEFISLSNGITEQHLDLIHNFYNNPDKKTMMMIILDKGRVSERKGIALAGSLTERYAEKYPPEDKEKAIVALISNWRVDDEVSYVNAPNFLFFLVQYDADLNKGIDILKKAGYYDNLTEGDLVVDATSEHPIVSEKKAVTTGCPFHKKEIEIDFYKKD